MFEKKFFEPINCFIVIKIFLIICNLIFSEPVPWATKRQNSSENTYETGHVRPRYDSNGSASCQNDS